MIHSIEQLVDQPLFFILYPTGASGEFLAYSLTSSIHGLAKSDTHWEGQARVKFLDCLGRSLNATDVWPEEHKLIERFNLFLQATCPGTDQLLVALAHPHATGTNFIQQYFSKSPVLEITTTQQVSQHFRQLAADEKIGPKQRHCYAYFDCGKTFDRHLKVEWAELLLNDTQQQYQRICDFLQLSGDFNEFQQCLQDYLQKNQHLIGQLSES